MCQEPRSIKPDLIKKNKKMTMRVNGGNSSHRNFLDFEAKNSLQDLDLPSKKMKIYQEPGSISANLVEETRKMIAGTSSGNHSHHNHGPYENLCFRVQQCEELMQMLLGLGINHMVCVLGKKLSEIDVNPNQNYLQHSEKEVQQVSPDMMMEEK